MVKNGLLPCVRQVYQPLVRGGEREERRTNGSTILWLLAGRLSLLSRSSRRTERIGESEWIRSSGSLSVERTRSLSELTAHRIVSPLGRKEEREQTYAGIRVLPILPKVSNPPPAANNLANSAFFPSSFGGRC